MQEFIKFLYFHYLCCSSGVFLHDPRCCSVTAKSITRLKNKNKDDCIADSLYWPAMPRTMVMQYPDNGPNQNGRPKNPYQQGYEDHHESEQQPHTVQPYCVPVPQQDQYHLHDAAVYSMWMHFVDFCLANASPSSSADSAMCYAAVDVAVNPYSRSKRLPVFRTLCRGSQSSHPTLAPPVDTRDVRDLRREVGPPPSKQLQFSPQTAPMQAPIAPISAPLLAPSRAIAPPATAVAPVSALLLDVNPAAEDSFNASALLARTPPSPAALVRRQSTTSPVSIIDADALEFDDFDYVDVEDLCDANDNDDCGLSAGLAALLGGAPAAPAPPAGGVSPLPAYRLQKQNLPQNLVSPMLLQGLF